MTYLTSLSRIHPAETQLVSVIYLHVRYPNIAHLGGINLPIPLMLPESPWLEILSCSLKHTFKKMEKVHQTKYIDSQFCGVFDGGITPR